MSGWCPRCDEVRPGSGTCPECGATLIAMDHRQPVPHVRTEEPVAEVGAVVEAPPRARLRVALAVAAVVLVGLAFIAGRGTGRAAPRTASRAAAAPTTTSPSAVEQQRQLGWRSGLVHGVSLEVVSVSRTPSDDPNSDNLGELAIRVDGLDPGRRLLGIGGLRLLDSGGGVFATPDQHPVGGVAAVLVQPPDQDGSYLVDLGPTPAVETLASIEVKDLLVSAPPSARHRLELPSDGPWPARPPMRPVTPPQGSVTVAVPPVPGGNGSATLGLPLRVTTAFVGAGRAVVVLTSEAASLPPDVGAFPVSARLLAGDRVACSRVTVYDGGSSQPSPLLVVDCRMAPTARLAVELGAGVDAVQLDAKLAG